MVKTPKDRQSTYREDKTAVYIDGSQLSLLADCSGMQGIRTAAKKVRKAIDYYLDRESLSRQFSRFSGERQGYEEDGVIYVALPQSSYDAVKAHVSDMAGIEDPEMIRHVMANALDQWIKDRRLGMFRSGKKGKGDDGYQSV